MNPDYNPFLGPNATPDQQLAFTDVLKQVNSHWLQPDFEGVRANALSGAAAIIRGDANLTHFSDLYKQQRDATQDTLNMLYGAIIASEPTMSERAIARITGIHRDTVRKALGKAK